MSDAATQLELHALVAKFANSFDLKDWQALGECLADSVYVDYSELRGTPAETLITEVPETVLEPLSAAVSAWLRFNWVSTRVVSATVTGLVRVTCRLTSVGSFEVMFWLRRKVVPSMISATKVIYNKAS